MPQETLEHRLRGLTREGELFERLPDAAVRCFACAHECRIKPGRSGVCRVRFNREGALRVPFGYTAGMAVDPIEKKPFYHVLPGSPTLSFGMLGCDFRCDFCQNWLSSQTLRDPEAGAIPTETTAEELVRAAVRHKAPVVASTYNEPLITAEWAAAVFEEAKKAGLRCACVSNGYGTPRVLRFLKPWLDFYKADLKSFDDRSYRRICGARLAPVLRTIEDAAGLGFWVEVVTLVIPGLNDSDAELEGMASFIGKVSRDIPWHLTAFHGDYKMGRVGRTPPATLLRAAEIGRAAGLRFVYAGNISGTAGDLQNTRCPGCGAALVEREGFRVKSCRVARGSCPDCGHGIPGVWE